MSLLICCVITMFILGFVFYLKSGNSKFMEGLTNNEESKCPNMLIQHDKNFYLYNSKLAKIPGVNPVKFNNLEDYVEFLSWQRSQGIRCPVLYLQKTYDAQVMRFIKLDLVLLNHKADYLRSFLRTLFQKIQIQLYLSTQPKATIHIIRTLIRHMTHPHIMLEPARL